MFSTTELQALVGVMNGKTLAQIGEDLMLSHPSVSKVLRAAEHKAGLPLVEQRGRRLQLTVDGAQVAMAAEEVLLKLRDLDRLLVEVKEGESGALRILSTNTICSYVLPPVIGELLGSVREIDLRIQAASDIDIWPMFDRGDFEIAIARNLPPPHIPGIHLFDDQLCLCVAADSDLAGQADTDWAQISNRTLIGPIGEDAMWRQFSLLGIQGRSRIQVPDVALAKRLVEDGHAIALLYRTVALEEAVAGRIVMLRLPDAPASVSYWMATRGGPALSQLTGRFTRLLQAYARNLAAATQTSLAGR